MTIPSQILQSIQRLSSGQYEKIRKIRRELHQHPELSGFESWTSDYISRELEDTGLNVRNHVGGYGIVADLITDPTLPTAALRVDMDALPINEVNQVPFRSKIKGMMHACGHDVHSAIGIGVASVLSNLKEDLPGNIRFFFQPEEEEITGALRMIHAGALAHPKPAAIFGLHVAPLPVGQVAWTDGLFLAGFDHYLVTLSPIPGWDIHQHHLTAIAQRCCHKIHSLNQWELPETWEEMQAFWQLMKAGPKKLREFIVYDASLNEEEPDAWPGQFGVGVKAASIPLRKKAFGKIKAVINALCRMTHTRYQIEKMGSMIDMRNNSSLVQATLPTLQSAIGADHLSQLQAAFPFNCEDFAFFAQRIPGAMIWLGAADPDNGKFAMLHTPDFDVDERCLMTGSTAMTALLWAALHTNTE